MNCQKNQLLQILQQLIQLIEELKEESEKSMLEGLTEEELDLYGLLI